MMLDIINLAVNVLSIDEIFDGVEDAINKYKEHKGKREEELYKRYALMWMTIASTKESNIKDIKTALSEHEAAKDFYNKLKQ